MAEVPPAAAPLPAPQGPSIRGFLSTILISGAIPFIVYELLTAYAPSLSKVMALAIAGIAPAVHSLSGIVARKYIDIVGMIVVAGIVVSIVATYFGGDPKLLLIRESFVTGALGLIALSSFAWRRPMIFYMGRQFSAGADPAQIARFDALWERPRARRTFRIMTAVWAIGWLGEFALRVAMVETLTVPQVLAISPFVFNGITVGMMAWTLAYARRSRRRGEEAAAREAAARPGGAPG